jgi:anaerobic magnesium-protoporphyrin IX monomethyl ester cyclase
MPYCHSAEFPLNLLFPEAKPANVSLTFHIDPHDVERRNQNRIIGPKSSAYYTGISYNFDMSKILLVNPDTNYETTAGRYRRFMTPMPPLSLAYLAAALKRAGIDVGVYDGSVASGGRSALLSRIREDRPDVVGLPCVTPAASVIFNIARDIRDSHPEIKIIMGNIHASIFYDDILKKNLADAIVLNEGEVTAVELVNALVSCGDLSNVRGIAYRMNGSINVTEPQSFVENLDSLPFPDWSLFPHECYRIINFARTKTPGTVILGSRGCAYRCNFCCLKIMGGRRRARSAGNIADEFEYMISNFGYRHFVFVDPIFPISKKEGMQFSEEISSRGLNKTTTWATQTRVDLVDYELLAELKKSGLNRIMFGFESGNQKKLDSIDKNFTLEQSRQAVSAAKKAGLLIIGFFMLGIPQDTKESMNETIRFSRSLGIDFVKFTIFTPFPGTRIYDELRNTGGIPDNPKWEQFTNYPSRETPAVYTPENIYTQDLINIQRKAFFSFFLRLSVIYTLLFRVRMFDFRDLKDGFITLLRK